MSNEVLKKLLKSFSWIMERFFFFLSFLQKKFKLLMMAILCSAFVMFNHWLNEDCKMPDTQVQRVKEKIVLGKHNLMKSLTHVSKKGTLQHAIQRSIRDFCKESDFQRFGITEKQFLYSDKAGVVYCSVPKVACTSWKKVLHLFNGKVKSIDEFKRREEAHEIKIPDFTRFLRKRRIMEWKINHYYTFMFVRHPFERIVSAYRNKLSDPDSTYYQKSIGSIILRKYREGLSPEEYTAGRSVTFVEFINFILDQYKEKGLAYFDPHWQLIVKLCNPCRTKYNFVGKMENLLEDADFILNSVGYNISDFPVYGKDRYQQNINELMETHFAEIPETWIAKLYKIYEPDFLAFNYSVPEILKNKFLKKKTLQVNLLNSTESGG